MTGRTLAVLGMLVTLVLVGPLSLARGEEPAAGPVGQLEDALPEDIVMLFKVADWSRTLKDLGDTALGRIGAEEDVQDYLKGLKAAFRDAAAVLEKDGAFRPADFPAAYGTELAVVSANCTRPSGGERRAAAEKAGKPEQTMALVARIGDEAAAGRVNALILKMLSDKARKVEPIDWDNVKGHRIRSGKDGGVPEPSPGSEARLYLLRTGRWQMLAGSANEDDVRRLAQGLAAGKCAKPLSENPDFKRCRARLPGRADLFTWHAVGAMIDEMTRAASPRDRERAAAALKVSGIGELRGMASTVAVEPPGFRSRSMMLIGRGDEGLAGLLNGAPLSEDLLRLAPSGSTLLLAGGVRTERILPLIRKLAAAGGRDPAAFEADLAEAGRPLGLDVEKDIAAALGSHGCVLAMPSRSVGGNPLLGQLNGLVLAVEVRDAAAARRVLDRLLEKARTAAVDKPDDVTINTFDYRGRKITSFDFRMVCPAVAVTDRYLLLGGSVQAVKKIIVQLSAGPAKAPAALVADEKYRKAMARVETEDAVALAYFDVSDVVSTAMAGMALIGGFLVPFLDAGAAADPGGDPLAGGEDEKERLARKASGLVKQLVNPATMPPPEAVTRHLFPAVASVRWVEDGLLTDEFSPLGFSGVTLVSPHVLGVCAVAVAMGISLKDGREAAETNAVVSCRAYAAAQATFRRNDWDGDGVMEYAPDFAELNTVKDGNGEPIQLIDAAFAAARGPGSPNGGYYFVNMKTIGGAAVDWTNDFALCAVPAVHGKTGRRTFIISTNGTVFGIDNGGKPVEDYPADPAAAGWVIAE